MSRRVRSGGLAAAMVVMCGCGGGGGGVSLVSGSKLQQQNVMVIDEGMDLSVPDLQDHVTAAYTETCPSDTGGGGSPSLVPDGGPVDAGAAFDSLKQMFITELSQTDDSCHLTTGISAKKDPLSSISQYKARWNQMIRNNQTAAEVFTSAEIAALQTPLTNELMDFSFHGTATSSTVAHANPTVRLVMVERQLMSESQVQAGFTCFDQAEIDQLVALLNDPQVFAAAANQKATLDADLAAAMSAHDVGLVNESFGTTARSVLEQMQTAQCPTPVDLSGYFAVLTGIDLAHAATLTGPAVLTIRAAGNDGANINSAADALDCNPTDPSGLAVGSYDPANGVQNQFSNFGTCVNLFAPGQGIVTTYAGGWLLPVDGTSFASPLTVRFASMNAPSPFSVATARQAVLASIDGTGELPASLFPTDFFYGPAETTPDAIVALPLHPAVHRGIAAVDLHKILAPLQRFRALRGH